MLNMILHICIKKAKKITDAQELQEKKVVKLPKGEYKQKKKKKNNSLLSKIRKADGNK